MKPIRLSGHALRYTSKRGFTIPEIEETIRTSPWMPAELGRLDCRRDFPYGKELNGKVYADQTGSPDLRRGSWSAASGVYGALAPSMNLLRKNINGANSCDHGLHLLF